MLTRIAILGDLIYPAVSSGNGELDDVLMLRAVNRINREIKPHAVLITGNMIANGNPSKMENLRKAIDQIEPPQIIIPGIDEEEGEIILNTFPEIPDYLDIRCCRIIPFVDERTGKYSFRRSKNDLQRMVRLTENFSGPVISMQHIPFHQLNTDNCKCHYDNADEIIELMKKSGVKISISGHCPNSLRNNQQNYGTAISGLVLSEKPFPFLELLIDENGKVDIKEHRLSIPAELELFDYHVHTRFAYCSENMDFAKTVKLAEIFNLKGFSFTEHNRHLYYPKSELQKPAVERKINDRFDEYFQEVNKYRSKNIIAGMEVDADFAGKPTVRASDMERFDLIIGALHGLPPLSFENPTVAESNAKGILRNFISNCRMDILAHPTRIFWKGREGGMRASEDTLKYIVKLMKEHDVAAELNMHSFGNPDPKFFRICLEEKVKISFGSDAHNLYEIGDFYKNIKFMKDLGIEERELHKIIF